LGIIDRFWARTISRTNITVLFCSVKIVGFYVLLLLPNDFMCIKQILYKHFCMVFWMLSSSLPEKYHCPSGWVLKLLKAIYGLHQVPVKFKQEVIMWLKAHRCIAANDAETGCFKTRREE
jgi:hypothetical protein